MCLRKDLALTPATSDCIGKRHVALGTQASALGRYKLLPESLPKAPERSDAESRIGKSVSSAITPDVRVRAAEVDIAKSLVGKQG
jgi:hypothetical protein